MYLTQQCGCIFCISNLFSLARLSLSFTNGLISGCNRLVQERHERWLDKCQRETAASALRYLIEPVIEQHLKTFCPRKKYSKG